MNNESWKDGPVLYTLDEAGNPIPGEELQRDVWLEKGRVARTDITGTIFVSTSFTGVDARFTHREPPLCGNEPLLWRTHIHGVENQNNSYEWFYPSKAEALKGHDVVVNLATDLFTQHEGSRLAGLLEINTITQTVLATSMGIDRSLIPPLLKKTRFDDLTFLKLRRALLNLGVSLKTIKEAFPARYLSI